MLVIILSDEINCFWFYGILIFVLEVVVEVLDLLFVILYNNEINYIEKVVEVLYEIKKLGVEMVCFGDIDIE